jgi:hypothetical protein
MKRQTKIMKLSGWIRLNKENLEKIPDGPGIYKIGYPRTLNRAVGSDKEGLLVIGSATLRHRIGQFHTSIREDTKTAPHSEGYRFHALGMAEFFPTENLRFKFKRTNNEKEAQRLEGEELVKYQDKHRELPPLNNIGGR